MERESTVWLLLISHSNPGHDYGGEGGTHSILLEGQSVLTLKIPNTLKEFCEHWCRDQN